MATSSSSTPSFPPTRTSTPSDGALLKDDYTHVDLSSMSYWTSPTDLTLESGERLPTPTVCYRAYGTMNAARDNAMIICHALTGHADVQDWWGSMLGPGLPFDTSRYFVICCNLLGSCYGSTGPTSINPLTQRPYRGSFPIVTIRDSVNLFHRLLVDHLHVQRLVCAIGGSLGGMQALEWLLIAPKLVQSAVALSCNARHSAWQIGINHVQRQAIMNDPAFLGGEYPLNEPPAAGLALARQIAMISYRTHSVYQSKFGRELVSHYSASSGGTKAPSFEVERYLLYQGNKILKRFDANSYIRMTQLIDSHDVGRNRSDGDCHHALMSITQPVLVLGIDSDVLYPIHEQVDLACMISSSKFATIISLEGHDGFLLEQEQISSHLISFLKQHAQPQSSCKATSKL